MHAFSVDGVGYGAGHFLENQFSARYGVHQGACSALLMPRVLHYHRRESRPAQERVAAEVALPPGYRVDYGGQFENLEAATARLALVVPLSLVLIFVLLFQTFGSIRLAAIIYLCVPLSIVGGVGMLYLLGLPFSISAGVGFRYLCCEKPGPSLFSLCT